MNCDLLPAPRSLAAARPVSPSREYELREGESIVSKTDLKGRITYVNSYFVEASGYPREELIGAPHNIVRHPDMPREAFADMWRTIREGLPWSGLVKNRRKDGDFYWVVANATPVREQGAVTGYISVRTRPTRAQAAEAEGLYRAIREGRARGIALRRGTVVRTGLAGWLEAIRDIPLRARIALSLGGAAALLAASAAGEFLRPGGGPLWGGLALAAIAVLGHFGWELHRTVVRPLAAAGRAARAIAGGDLSTSFPAGGGDDVGQLFRALQQMKVNLRSIVSDIRTNLESMHASTNEIAAGNDDLSHRTGAQAVSLEGTASSMEEISAAVKQTAAHAAEADRLAASATEVAVQGGEAFARVGATLKGIHASSRKIAAITDLIDEIAFQTNILALNAAVEAARAGQSGQGFAVVADEVRALSQRSAEAARQIGALVEESVARAEEGDALGDAAGRLIGRIIDSARGVGGLIRDISTAGSEQSAGVAQVNGAILDIDQATQQNAALVEQAAASTANLEAQAGELLKTVSLFNLEGPGRS